MIFILFYTPIALISKLFNNAQNEKGMPNLMMFNTNQQMYIPYIVIFFLIIVLFFIVFIIGLYYSDNQEDYFHNRLFIESWFGGAVFFAVFAFFIFFSYIMQNIINQFNYSDYYATKTYDAEGLSVLAEFYKKVFGYGEDQQFDGDTYKYIYLNHISGISVTLFTMIVVMIIILSIINSSYFNSDHLDAENTKIYIFIMKYCIIMPSVLLFVLLFFIINIMEFNRFMNKYLLDEPIKDYKEKISLLNDKINSVLDQENSDTNFKRDDEYICRNNRNAILMVLYSHIFNNVQYLSPNGDDDHVKIFIDVTPEFTYDSKCDNNVPYFSSNQSVYDINYYLNGKANGTNIFYKFNKCNEINECVLNAIERNLLHAVDGSDDTQKMDFSYTSNCVDVKFKLEISNAGEIKDIKDDDKLVENIRKNCNLCRFKNKLTSNIHYALDNVNNIPPLNLTSNIIDLTKTASYVTNNKLANFYDIKTSDKKDYEKYDKIIENYMDMIYEFIYIHLNYKDEKAGYVQKLNVLIKKTFMNINKELSTSVKLSDGKLTQYIINNYNTIHMQDKNKNKIYMKNTLYKSDTSKDETYNINNRIVSNIKDHFDVVKKLDVHTVDTKKLYNLVYSGDYAQYNIDNTKVKNEFDKNFELFKKKCVDGHYISDIEIINTSNINYIIYKDYILKTCKHNNNNAPKTIYNLTYNVFDVNSNCLVNIAKIKASDRTNLNKSIDKYLEDASRNIHLLKKAHLEYNNRNYIEPPDTVNSEDILQKAKETNNLIYFLILNYIIAFVMIFLIENNM
jgi:hypothetical protein